MSKSKIINTLDPKHKGNVKQESFNPQYLEAVPRESTVHKKGDVYLYQKEFYIYLKGNKLIKLKPTKTKIYYGIIDYCQSTRAEKVGKQLFPFLEEIDYVVYIQKISSKKKNFIKNEINIMPFIIEKDDYTRQLKAAIRILRLNNLDNKVHLVGKAVGILKSLLKKAN